MQNIPRKAQKRARKFALSWLGLNEDSNIAYCCVANAVYENDDKCVIEGIDLNDSEAARRFLLAWAYRHGMH